MELAGIEPVSGGVHVGVNLPQNHSSPMQTNVCLFRERCSLANRVTQARENYLQKGESDRSGPQEVGFS